MKTILLCIGLTVMVVSCHSPNEYRIEGNVKGFDNQKVFLTTRLSLESAVDSVEMTDGKFVFKSDEAYPDRRNIMFEKVKSNLSLFIERGVIKIEGTPEKLVASGTESNDLNILYREKKAEIENKYNPNAPDRLYWTKFEELNDSVIKAHPTAVLSAELLSRVPTMTYEEIDSLINLVPDMPANAYIDKLKERREKFKALAVGQPVPDFTLETIGGNEFTLSSLKGKVIAIEFWASWCSWCRKENPLMVNTYNKYHDSGFEVVSISVDTDKDRWAQAVLEDKLPWMQVLNNNKSGLSLYGSSVAHTFCIIGIPMIFIIDQDFNIAAVGLRGDAVATKVGELLGE